MNLWMTTITSLAAGACVAASLALVQGDPPSSSAKQPTATVKGERATPDAIDFFFDTFQHHPERRDEAIVRLTERALASDALPKEILYTGLAHLWALAEGASDRVKRHEHAVLAEHWIAHAATNEPDDTRIAGWRQSAAWAVAAIEGDVEKQAAAIRELEALAIEDPCFNSITLGSIAFELPPDHPTFQRALTAMNAAFECGQTKGGQDRPHWPFSVAGFLVTLADYRLKAGDTAGAEAALVAAESRESTVRWPHRALLDERLGEFKARSRAFANADLTDDPRFAIGHGGASCSVCHAAPRRSN
jgi:hypothetical protein